MAAQGRTNRAHTSRRICEPLGTGQPGGCGGKLDGTQLAQLVGHFQGADDARMLVGPASLDDAGVYALNPDLALVQTVDLITPLVDDPRAFGRIAAANALSDIYAMAATPITALNIALFPAGERPLQELMEILAGAAEIAIASHTAIVGGHTIDHSQPFFGWSVTGVANPALVVTNSCARPGDVVILTKPLGTGIVTAAHRLGQCTPHALAAAIASMETLNEGAAQAIHLAGVGADRPVHAMTDISGFGLLGHLLQLATASDVALELTAGAVPVLPGSEELAQQGHHTAGGDRNLAYVEPALARGTRVSAARAVLLTDPQTSGGLVIAVDQPSSERVLRLLRDAGSSDASVIGQVVARDGSAVLKVD